MHNTIFMIGVVLTFWSVISVPATTVTANSQEFNGWKPFSPRDEIRPDFHINRNGGPDEQGSLVIKHDDRKGLDGAWAKTFEIEGDCHYCITVYSQLNNVNNPRHHTYVELLFHDADGSLVPNKRTGVQSRPFYPPDVETDQNGWMKFTGIYRAPKAASHVTVKLHLRWEPRGQVEWGGVTLIKTNPRPSRKVRLAACNYRPRGGKTALDNLSQLRPYIAQAAKQRANLLVLGECITSVGNNLSYVEVAESVPGPSTNYLGRLAKQYNIYIVTTLNERVGHLIYNTAVLLGPEGKLIGKYRKICPARGEYRKGIAPGRQFPVFNTDIGKIGMMICFDVHMPEVARGLVANGAEIVAMPIMGGHPALARARAIENQIYLVTSTYSINDDWMQTGIWDLSGNLLVRATQKNKVVFAEVDLSEQYFWRANMGEFKGRLRHERPAVQMPK